MTAIDSGTVTALAAGSAHACAIDAGTVECWGWNEHGQLGAGVTDVDSPIPLAVSLPSSPVSIASSFRHTCAVLADASVWCWGYNSDGQLGDGTLVSQNAPVQVQDLGPVASVATGGRHTCAVLPDGTVSCWGANDRGQSGQTPGGPIATPTRVPDLTAVAELVAGASHTCARLTDGQAVCWGSNANGQLGDGALSYSTVPVAVSAP